LIGISSSIRLQALEGYLQPEGSREPGSTAPARTSSPTTATVTGDTRSLRQRTVVIWWHTHARTVVLRLEGSKYLTEFHVDLPAAFAGHGRVPAPSLG